MKFLFKIIVIPILSIIAIPAILLALTYKDVAIPVDDFSGSGTVTLTSMISDEMDTFLETNDVDSTVGLHLTQQDANGLLKTTFVGINPNYLSDTATADEKNYVMKEDLYGYQGSWIRFKDDIVEIESGLHVFVAGFTYKTAVLMTFKLNADTEEVVLKLEKLNVGSLPLAWTFGAVSWAAEKITGNDIQTMIDDQLNGLATFDPEKREIRLDVQTLVDNAFSDDAQSAALVNSLMQFIAQNDLLDIGFIDGEFNVDLALGKLKDDSTPFILADTDKIADDAALQAILEAKATSLIISTLTTTTDPFIELQAFTLNRMFEYFMRDSLASAGVIHEVLMFDDQYKITAYVPYITMDDDFVVNIPMLIEDVAIPANSFPTIIKISATPEINGSDLRIVLNELIAGEVSLTEEHISNILSLLGDNDFIIDGAFVIENFDAQMSQVGLGLQSVAVVNNKLRLYVELNDTIALGDIQDAVSDILDVVGANDYSPELNDALDDVIDSLIDPLADPEQAVEDLLDVMDTLTDAEQAEVYQDLVDAFGDTGLDYEDMLGLLP